MATSTRKKSELRCRQLMGNSDNHFDNHSDNHFAKNTGKKDVQRWTAIKKKSANFPRFYRRFGAFLCTGIGSGATIGVK